mmetsp:Transcript_44014/g.138726  ORF Transcript_44014/g.138726 Transcript_44014/m.138726 type:complete len:334 (+) Transcript_44014:372-1373(+)
MPVLAQVYEGRTLRVVQPQHRIFSRLAAVDTAARKARLKADARAREVSGGVQRHIERDLAHVAVHAAARSGRIGRRSPTLAVGAGPKPTRLIGRARPTVDGEGVIGVNDASIGPSGVYELSERGEHARRDRVRHRVQVHLIEQQAGRALLRCGGACLAAAHVIRRLSVAQGGVRVRELGGETPRSRPREEYELMHGMAGGGCFYQRPQCGGAGPLERSEQLRRDQTTQRGNRRLGVLRPHVLRCVALATLVRASRVCLLLGPLILSHHAVSLAQPARRTRRQARRPEPRWPVAGSVNHAQHGVDRGHQRRRAVFWLIEPRGEACVAARKGEPV